MIDLFYVKIQNGSIIAKGKTVYNTSIKDWSIENEGYTEISQEIYDQLTRLPADFETDDEGNIISVTPAPEPEPQPQPPSLEDRLKAVEDALLSLL